MISISKSCDKILKSIMNIQNNHIIQDIKDKFLNNKWDVEIKVGQISEQIKLRSCNVYNNIIIDFK